MSRERAIKRATSIRVEKQFHGLTSCETSVGK